MIGIPFAPGSRLLFRDEEWLVKTALPTNTGGTAVRVMIAEDSVLLRAGLVKILEAVGIKVAAAR